MRVFTSKFAQQRLPRVARFFWYWESLLILSRELGHFKSAWFGIPRIKGSCVPWVNYSAFEFLRLYAPTTGRVFEYGAGASTIWWAKRGLSVTAVEYKKDWAGKIFELAKKEGVQNLVSILVETELEKYPEVINQSNFLYEVISVDGECLKDTRLKCFQAARHKLTWDGLLIIDNIDWLPKTRKAAVEDLSFHPIILTGFTPCVPYVTACMFLFKNIGNLQNKGPRVINMFTPIGAVKNVWE